MTQLLSSPVWQMIAFFSTSIATRFQLDEFPSVVSICIGYRTSFDLHLTDGNQGLVSDNLYLGRIALCSVCLQRGHWESEEKIHLFCFPGVQDVWPLGNWIERWFYWALLNLTLYVCIEVQWLLLRITCGFQSWCQLEFNENYWSLLMVFNIIKQQWCFNHWPIVEYKCPAFLFPIMA